MSSLHVLTSLATLMRALDRVRSEIAIMYGLQSPELLRGKDRCPIVVHFDSSAVPNQFSDANHPIVLSSRQIQDSAQTSQESYFGYPRLNVEQLTSFIDRELYEFLGPELQSINVRLSTEPKDWNLS
jgi:hypothetical protein